MTCVLRHSLRENKRLLIRKTPPLAPSGACGAYYTLFVQWRRFSTDFIQNEAQRARGEQEAEATAQVGLRQHRRRTCGSRQARREKGVERVMGLEPTTPCLGSRHSTAELHPLSRRGARP